MPIKKKNLPCEVTGKYLITKQALLKAGNSQKYSNGDLEVVAFELAMEAYRAELILTNNKNNTYTNTTGDVHSTINNVSSSDILSGGQCYDAGFLLSGEKSEVYSATSSRHNSVAPYKDGKYGYITREEMARRTDADISMYQHNKAMPPVNISETSNFTTDEKAIDDMLKKYEGKEGEYALTFSVRVDKDGPDGVTKESGGHAITIVKITSDTIYAANPWHPEKIEPIPRADFIKMCTGLVAMPVKNPATSAPSRPTTPSKPTTAQAQALINKLKNKE